MWSRKTTWSKVHVTLWQEPIKVSCHPAMFGGCRHCGSGLIMVLVSHMILQEHVIKWSCDFINRSPPFHLILNWQNNTQVFRRIPVFFKNCLRRFGWQPIIRYIWNDKIFNKLNFLIKSTLWQIIKVTTITIKTNQWH